MRKYYLLCVFLYLVGHLQGLKDCGDCVKLNSCSRATDLAIHNSNSDTEEKFKNSFCGYEGSGYKKIPKVCCSDFEDDEGKDDIENHPNINLLPDSCGDIDGRRIVGGATANLYEYPWMALISYKTRLGLQFQCGGSIINSRYILTAAHCVRNRIIAGVRIGEYDIRYGTDCQGTGDQYACESHIQDMIVEEIIFHESYVKTSKTVANDIALLRLIKPINFTYRNAAPICLPITASMRNTELSGRQATVAGWGLTENNEDSSILLKVEVPIWSSSQCSSFYNRWNVDTELCAGAVNKDSCEGDSGGPLMLESTYKGAYRIIQYGIVSRGPQNCGSNNPGIYTNVTKFMGWILDNIRE
ncbi:CLIP domain-containing serine protease 14D-like [Aricia agestis]|uniref:CLIP domain-containing serine protease 14D-like n=1 Tax=Aricia agestis TaxID=91739 RepID=UPI001C202FE1|nr:CLIP domain-containing serine protease 14D-like [Aricia agestis]